MGVSEPLVFGPLSTQVSIGTATIPIYNTLKSSPCRKALNMKETKTNNKKQKQCKGQKSK